MLMKILLSENVDEMLITWSTFNATPNSIVEYGIDELTDKAEGYSKKFVDGGKEKRIQYIHRVRLTNLKPLTKYGKCSLNLFVMYLTTVNHLIKDTLEF